MKINKKAIKVKPDLINENGAVAIIVAVCLSTFLIVILALVIDVGSLYEERRNLQTVADLAALSGAQELPESREEAIQKAIENASEHGINITSENVDIGSTGGFGDFDDTITVTINNPDPQTYFTSVIGSDSVSVGARAKAIVKSPERYEDVMAYEDIGAIVPWGIPMQKWNEYWSSYYPGKEYTFWRNSLPGYSSYPPAGENFVPLDLGGSSYRANIEGSYSASLKFDDEVGVLFGNLFSHTRYGTRNRVGGYNEDPINDLASSYSYLEGGYQLSVPDSQFCILPIVSEEVSEKVKILGFAPFIITGNDWSFTWWGWFTVSISGVFLNKALINIEGPTVPLGTNGPTNIRVIRLKE